MAAVSAQRSGRYMQVTKQKWHLKQVMAKHHLDRISGVPYHPCMNSTISFSSLLLLLFDIYSTIIRLNRLQDELDHDSIMGTTPVVPLHLLGLSVSGSLFASSCRSPSSCHE